MRTQVQELRGPGLLFVQLSLVLLSWSGIVFWVVTWNIGRGFAFSCWGGFHSWHVTGFICILYTLVIVSKLAWLLLFLLLLSHISYLSPTLSWSYISSIFSCKCCLRELLFSQHISFACCQLHKGGDLFSSWNLTVWEANFLPMPLRREFPPKGKQSHYLSFSSF